MTNYPAKVSFYDFYLQVPVEVGRCGTQTVLNLINNTVYCLWRNVLVVCFDLCTRLINSTMQF